MKNKQEKLYIAYGSNLNLPQMARRCPTAKVVGKSLLRGWRLVFRGSPSSAVATVERMPRHSVPVLVWRLQPADERALDAYEGWPRLYRKETIRLTLKGRRVYAMIYIMNEDRHPYGAPSPQYFCTILTGYRSAGFDPQVLRQAAIRSMEEPQKQP